MAVSAVSFETGESYAKIAVCSSGGLLSPQSVPIACLLSSLPCSSGSGGGVRSFDCPLSDPLFLGLLHHPSMWLPGCFRIWFVFIWGTRKNGWVASSFPFPFHTFEEDRVGLGPVRRRAVQHHDRGLRGPMGDAGGWASTASSVPRFSPAPSPVWLAKWFPSNAPDRPGVLWAKTPGDSATKLQPCETQWQIDPIEEIAQSSRCQLIDHSHGSQTRSQFDLQTRDHVLQASSSTKSIGTFPTWGPPV